ncbi:MAG: hypothetical protein TH68_09300 [Candidatus Synechococcus spongiarum 142]|uniref:Uncharacterized protein n=1 Tax=Candidatus Synechococcus spongiarum 142 TaxID=1608213 RepID=A0A6N3X6U5_9SYNE|nr:MAG: hypothetical protein TH68_09300 [Candidatus Synechococcus spongiarum 142]
MPGIGIAGCQLEHHELPFMVDQQMALEEAEEKSSKRPEISQLPKELRGHQEGTIALFAYVSMEERIPANHPLHQIRLLVRPWDIEGD